MKKQIVLITTCLFLAVASSALAADFVLVVSNSNPVETLSRKNAKQIFLGKKGSWDSGEKIILYSQYDRELTGAFANGVLNKSAQQFVTYWKRALFTGTGRPPVEVKNDAEMKKLIAADRRGIGYISRAMLDDSIKAVTLE